MAWAGLGDGVVSPDLVKERRQASFDVEALTNVVDGGADQTKRRGLIQGLVLEEPVFTQGPEYSFLSRTELHERATERSVAAVRLAARHNLHGNDITLLFSIAFPFEISTLLLHISMFADMMETQSTEEQKAKWLAKVQNIAIIGTYAQTELGHGTNVRALETTATYDPKAEQFVIHSPTLTAIKWWPGALGKTTNHCIVMAQLYSQGKHHGLHPFLVQFRSLDNHEPLPGVTVGDIGPKFGYDEMDNGFLKFDHFRVPRDHMLMRYAEVLPDGAFRRKSQGLKRPAYAAMTLARVGIVEACFTGLSSAATIAVRYSAVRHQSEIKPGSPEPQVLDFQTQQDKVLPHVAMAYAIVFVARTLRELSNQIMADGGATQQVPEQHALSAGLKAYVSYQATRGMEQCRLACGGHGYSDACGIPKAYANMSPACTYEGENTVMYMQTARFLVKCMRGLRQRELLAPSVAYLASQEGNHVTLDGNLHLDTLVMAFQQRALRLVTKATQRMEALTGQGVEPHDVWNQAGVDLTRAAEAHTVQFMFTSFNDVIRNIRDPAICDVMAQLCQLIAAKIIETDAVDFLQGGQLTEGGLDAVHARYLSLLAQLRPNAVSLVDAFDHHDVALSSILGRYDGKVYENMYEWAKRSPLNQTQVTPGYHKYLKPLMGAGAAKARL